MGDCTANVRFRGFSELRASRAPHLSLWRNAFLQILSVLAGPKNRLG
jgi:hypothetical protein